MNIIDTINIIENSLIAGTQDKNFPLYKICVEKDPFAQLENKLPFILIEQDKSKLVTNPQGYAYEYIHSLSLFCVTGAGKEKRDVYTFRAMQIAEGAIELLSGLNDHRLRIIPDEIVTGEVIVGSAKCYGAKILIDIKTNYKEN